VAHPSIVVNLDPSDSGLGCQKGFSRRPSKGPAALTSHSHKLLRTAAKVNSQTHKALLDAGDLFLRLTVHYSKSSCWLPKVQ